MKFTIPLFTIAAAFTLTACPKAEVAQQKDKTGNSGVTLEAPPTAMGVIQSFHDSLAGNCGQELPEVDFEELKKLEIDDVDREKADKLLADIGIYAQQCGSYSAPMKKSEDDGCNPDCDWCPIKWYWCIENAGACAGGDNKSCCKLGACGSKHHCKEVCQSSCGCDVPPLPSDGGGDGGDE